MSITFGCENCGKSFTIDDKFAGKKGRCKQCGAVMPIPMASAPPLLEVSPSRRSPATPSARPPREEIFGLDEPALPRRQALPAGIEEVEASSGSAGRFRPRPSLLYDAPRRAKQGSGGGLVLKIVLRVALGIVISLVGLGGSGAAWKSWTTASKTPGLTSRQDLEAMLQERVTLHDQLTGVLAKVDDVDSARQASPEANRKFRAITANLRKMKFVKALQSDIDALKSRFAAPQMQAAQQVLQHLLRIAAIPGAGAALDVEEAGNELDREEKSIPGMPQVSIPPRSNLPTPPALPNLGPQPGLNPNPQAGPPPGPNRQGNRPRPGSRKAANRPNPGGPG